MTARRRRDARVVPGPATSSPGEGAATPSVTVPDVPDAGRDITWGVGAVSDRLAVAASTLRTWERRYGIGPSFRTLGGHRRYTERDIDRVELMRRLVARGVSAQDAARVVRSLDRDELDIALADELDRKPVELAPEDLVDAVLAAVVTADQARLAELLRGLLRRGRLVDTWREVLSPALVRMSCECSNGTLPEASAGAATEALVRELKALVSVEHLPETGSTGILFARNVPESEALPLLALEAALTQAGVATRSVGPDVDARALAALVTSQRPAVLVTWGHPPDTGLRRAVEKLDGVTFVVRALPAWPHEVSLRFGIDAPLVSTNLGRAVEHLLDRVG